MSMYFTNDCVLDFLTVLKCEGKCIFSKQHALPFCVPNVRREKGKTNPLWEIRIRHFEGIYGDIVLYGMKSRIFLVDF